MSNKETTNEQAAAQPVFSIEKIYLKDMSLEAPHVPQIFLDGGEPQIEVRVATAAEKLENEFYNVSVTVTVTAKMPDERILFLNEVAQSGIFRIANIPQKDVDLLLAVAAPNILFPYARETVSSTITRAGFPPVMLAPINFEAMYQGEQANAGNA
ncbi:MAG: protein-export chaperone SecB [Snodgrassella sp.]|nr:protein-export chaperone SecB [Snodgrassella sp.]